MFRNVEEDKEELERLQDEIAFYNNTVLANKQQVTRENNKFEKETIPSNTSERSQEIGEAATVREVQPKPVALICVTRKYMCTIFCKFVL